MRRASIDRVNAKYLGARAGSYAGPPLAAALPYPSGHVIGAPTIIGAPVHYGLAQPIVSPPVYEIIQHQPVVEAVTTPGKVYEIVTPIVQVTPDLPIVTPQRRPGWPWWCWLLLGLLFLTILLAALAYLFRDELGLVTAIRVEERPQQTTNVVATSSVELTCKQGQHLVNGKCLSCPAGSTWNGKNCVKLVKTTEVVNETTKEEPQKPFEEQKKKQQETKAHLRYNLENIWT